MTTDTPIAQIERPSTSTYLAKLLAGPISFAVVMALPIGLVYEGRVALATFVCSIVWWMTQPMPWAVSAMLPFLVFPAAGVMNIADTMRLYGQPVFFWIMGTVLMGYAIEKHRLAQRFAIAFLAMRGIGGKTHRLMFAYMLVVGISTNFISGTVLYGSVFIPAASAFAAGEIGLKPMIRIGVITTAIFILIVATIHIVMAPFV